MEKSGKYTVGRIVNGIKEWSWLKFFVVLNTYEEERYPYPLAFNSRINGSFYYFRDNKLPKEVFNNIYNAMKTRFEIYYNMEGDDESKDFQWGVRRASREEDKHLAREES